MIELSKTADIVLVIKTPSHPPFGVVSEKVWDDNCLEQYLPHRMALKSTTGGHTYYIRNIELLFLLNMKKHGNLNFKVISNELQNSYFPFKE